MKILSVVEFGSSARLDNDDFSDRDLFVWIDEWVERDLIILNLTAMISGLDSKNCDFIIHDSNSFDHMLENGSLFLWHLKLEAKALFGELAFKEKISTLKTFHRYEDKFDNYLGVFIDLKNARKTLPLVSNFDFSVLFTVVRNLCILVCFKIGVPKFGRKDAYLTVLDFFPRVCIKKNDYEFLLKYKLEYERGFSLLDGDTLEIEEWILRVEMFSEQIKKILQDGGRV